MKRKREIKRCCVCGEEYQTFAIESWEAQIKDAEKMCKECLNTAVDEEYTDVEDDED